MISEIADEEQKNKKKIKKKKIPISTKKIESSPGDKLQIQLIFLPEGQTLILRLGKRMRNSSEKWRLRYLSPRR